MDEPTSALAAAEVEVLFGIIRDLLARGVAIVYISHHLEEALEVTDHAVVLRDGTMTAKGERADIDLEWIVRNMVGENFDLGSPPTGYDFGSTPCSASRNLHGRRSRRTRSERSSTASTLDVRAGEIVCIYGLMGAGRTELLEAVAGREPDRMPATSCSTEASIVNDIDRRSASRRDRARARGPAARRTRADVRRRART